MNEPLVRFPERFSLFFLKDSTPASEVQEFFKKHVLPLVGHRKQSNDAKRYTTRPLVVVYYGVDFSFDYRVGMCLSRGCCSAFKL